MSCKILYFLPLFFNVKYFKNLIIKSLNNAIDILRNNSDFMNKNDKKKGCQKANELQVIA